MSLPQLQPLSDLDLYVSGDVTIHPSAIVASGAIIQAAPGSKIVIGSEVCIGRGTIVTAYEGSIEIEKGVVLGAGVLIVGAGKIGSNACIGSATTIWQPSVEPSTSIAPGSLIGDPSRRAIVSDENEEVIVKPSPSEKSPPIIESSEVLEFKTPVEEIVERKEADLEPEDLWSDNSSSIPHQETPAVETTTVTETEIKSKPSNSPVVGQIYIEQLLVTLFPHRQFLNDLDLGTGKQT
jgi:carbon dioxide concentrating mechanism protein CcmN